MKKYCEIKFRLGNIESAIKELKSYQHPVCGSFNGVMLYSDKDDLNSAYKKITGKTKSEFDEEEKRRQAEYERELKKHKEAIPELTIEWVEKGKAILDEKHHELWSKIVPVRLGDLYRGMELGNTLDIVKELNNSCSFETAKDILKKQGHSGMSHSLVCSLIASFCDRGKEFIEYINQ